MKKRWIWACILIASVVVIISLNIYAINKSIDVFVVQVEEGELSEKVYASGKLEPLHEYFHYPDASGGTVQHVLVEQGDVVKKGQVLVKTDTKELERQLDLEVNNLAILEAEWKETQKAYFDQYKKLTMQGEDTDSLNKPDASIYELRAKNQRLSIEAIRDKISRSEIIAEGDGVVTEVNVKQGQMAPSGQSAVTVTDLATLRVRGNLNELDAGKVRKDMKVLITGDAFSNQYEGKVVYLSPQAVVVPPAKDPTVEVVVELKADTGDIRPGYNATLEISLPTEKQVIAPISAIKNEGEESFVYKEENGLAVKVKVKTGKDDGEQIEVTEGLQAGDTILSEVPEGLRVGSKIKVRSS